MNDAGYPPWTAQRVAAALQRYDLKYEETTAFLALGAGESHGFGAIWFGFRSVRFGYGSHV